MGKTYYGPGSTGAINPTTGLYGGQAPAPAPAPAPPPLFSPGNPAGTPTYSGSGTSGMFSPTAQPTVTGSHGGFGQTIDYTPVLQQQEARLQQQRDLAFQSLGAGANIFRGPLGQTAASSFLAGMTGGNVPFDAPTQSRLMARRADASGAAHATEQNRVRQFFSGNGMRGGGGELAALVGADRAHAGRMQQARNDVETKAQLENFAAMERAREGAVGFQSQQAQGEAPFRLKEADMRSRFEAIGQSPFGGAQGMFTPSGYSGGVVQAGGQMGFALPQGYGGVGGTGAQITPYQAQAATGQGGYAQQASQARPAQGYQTPYSAPAPGQMSQVNVGGGTGWIWGSGGWVPAPGGVNVGGGTGWL